MLFRFLEYSYENVEDRFENPHFLCGITVKKDYDHFFGMLKKSVGLDIEIKDAWYTIDQLVLHYDGNEEDDVFTCNVYCFSY